MKPGVSTLNPYAASYIPLSKREGGDKVGVPGMKTSASQRVNQSVWYGPAEHDTQNRYHDKTSYVPEVSTMKRQSAGSFYGSSSQNPNEVLEKQVAHEEFDMDLEYLQMTFPGISYESLTGVHIATRGDLEASIDMLTQLELDTSENLPDSLDIGDVSESGSSAESSYGKLKHVVGETSGCSSVSSGADSDSVFVT